MAEVIREWAGVDRPFSLSFGGIIDLEEACGKVGFGEIYLRLGQHRYFVRDVYHTIRIGMICGGMSSVDAKRLMDDRFDAMPMVERVELALDILLSAMSGIRPDETTGEGDATEPHDFGAIMASLVNLGVSPASLRDMRYADFVNMSRAFGGAKSQPPSEEEFFEMIKDLPKG